MTVIKKILYSIILILGISCYSGKIENQEKPNIVDSENSELNSNEKIIFDFKVEHIDTLKETFKINATLYNNSIDSIYFLSSTCDGEQYSLQYDKIKFELTPIIQCNASNPKIIKIKPNGQHYFKANFKYNGLITRMKLGFDFYSIYKTFKLSNTNLEDIYNRSKDKRTVIWADEKTVK